MLHRSLRVFLKKETTEFGIDRPLAYCSCILLALILEISTTQSKQIDALTGLDVNLQNCSFLFLDFSLVRS
jgi:hypothetical protein